MDLEEKKLRDRGKMIEESYVFWDHELNHHVDALDIEEDYETPEEYYHHLEAEEELKYILCHLNFESQEMARLEKDIIAFGERNEA